MHIFNKIEHRTKILLPKYKKVFSIEQEYNKAAKINCEIGKVSSSCLKCMKPKCLKYDESEVTFDELDIFSYDRNFSVCPVNAIKWNFTEEIPEINNNVCIKCGLCAQRCPVGAIFVNQNKVQVSVLDDYYSEVPITKNNLIIQKNFINEINKIKFRHQFQKENDVIMRSLYKSLEQFDGRSLVSNLLARNLMVALEHKCAISRQGNVHTRMDGIYWKDSTSCSTSNYKGTIEVEFGKDTLEAIRTVLDDIAVMHSRKAIDKMENHALVICLSLPNKRQGYFQVVKDIKKVEHIKIQTLTIGALCILAWNDVKINLSDRAFYVDFDKMNIRDEVESLLGRSITLKEGLAGILEPEK